MNLPQPSIAREVWAPERWGVVGATGFIGKALAEHLTIEGYDVTALPAPRVEFSPQVTDGADIATVADGHRETHKLAKDLAGLHVVINAAGLATPDSVTSMALYGANSLLPAIIAAASERAGVGRLIHLSSAAVQGERPVLDGSTDVAPFSPYSRSKALGERGVLAMQAVHNQSPKPTDIVIVRATSVQGTGRRTTRSLRRLAESPLASVAAPGDQPTVISSLPGLVRFVSEVGRSRDRLPAIVLQPWEGLSVRDVLEIAGGKPPLVLPTRLCKAVVAIAKLAQALVPALAGPVRRLELMWFGQRQETEATPQRNLAHPTFVQAILRGSDST